MRDRFLTFAVWFGLALAIGWGVHHVFGRPMRYEFPAGFKGWVVVKYGDPSCPPLSGQGIFKVVRVPASGRVCTSSRHDGRWIYYRFEYVHPNGRRESLPLRSGSDPPGKIQVWLVTYISEYQWEEDFVGSKEDARTKWGVPPDPWRQTPSSDTGEQSPGDLASDNSRLVRQSETNPPLRNGGTAP